MTNRIAFALIAGGAFAAVWSVSLASAQSLSIGDQAPDLGDHVEWVQGDPVPEFRDGHVYALDFWAPWCGPCIASIPHTNDLYNRYKDQNVTIIGLAIWPQSGQTPVEKFVKQQDERMSYPVAKDKDNAVAQAFMDATGQSGIPTAMVVDREGRLAWIGHPQGEMERVIEQVAAGEYDIDQVRRREQNLAKAQRLLSKANQLAADQKWDESFEVLEQVIAVNPDRFARYALIKFEYMVGRFGRLEKGYAYGREILDDLLDDKPGLLENMARFLVEVPDLERRDLDLALKAAERAAELTERNDPKVLETLALVCSKRGDAKRAHEMQKEALALVEDERRRSEMQARLQDYASAMKDD